MNLSISLPTGRCGARPSAPYRMASICGKKCLSVACRFAGIVHDNPERAVASRSRSLDRAMRGWRCVEYGVCLLLSLKRRMRLDSRHRRNLWCYSIICRIPAISVRSCAVPRRLASSRPTIRKVVLHLGRRGCVAIRICDNTGNLKYPPNHD